MLGRIELNPGDWIVWVTPDDPNETESPLFVADNGIDLYFTYAPADYPWTRMRGPRYEPTADARQVEAVLNGELQWPNGTFYKLNRPGMSGDSIRWKDEVHGTSLEVPGGAA